MLLVTVKNSLTGLISLQMVNWVRSAKLASPNWVRSAKLLWLGFVLPKLQFYLRLSNI